MVAIAIATILIIVAEVIAVFATEGIGIGGSIVAIIIIARIIVIAVNMVVIGAELA